jgi:hypothetical protein
MKLSASVHVHGLPKYVPYVAFVAGSRCCGAITAALLLSTLSDEAHLLKLHPTSTCMS